MTTAPKNFLPKRAPKLPKHRKVTSKLRDREPMPADERRKISLRFIIHARQELKAGRRLQAGEKAWGATAQYLKIIGDQRGWKHHNHQQVYAIGLILSAEEEQNHEPDSVGFNEAMSNAYRIGHENFYENHRSEEEIAATINAVENILPRLERIASSPFRPFTIASGEQKGRLETLTGRKDLYVGMPSDDGFAQPPATPRSVTRRNGAAAGKESRASGRSRSNRGAKGKGGDKPTEVNVLLS